MLVEEGCSTSFRFARVLFPTFYLQQLQARMLTAEEHVARDILAVRNRVAHWKEEAKRSIENIVPPRIHWLADLGLVSIENDGKRWSRLTEMGTQLSHSLPKIQGTPAFHTSSAWLREQFFGMAGQILMGTIDRQWTDIHEIQREKNCFTNSLFKLLKRSGVHRPQRFLYIRHSSIWHSILLRITESRRTLRNSRQT